MRHEPICNLPLLVPTDLAGNESTSATAQFRSWVTTGCSGLTFESFTTSATTVISALTGSPIQPWHY